MDFKLPGLKTASILSMAVALLAPTEVAAGPAQKALQVGQGDFDYYYTKDVFPELGKNCFDSTAQLTWDGFKYFRDDDDGENAEVFTIEMSSGFVCYFESFDNFMITTETGANNIEIYYFPYTGFGPEMFLFGQQTCQFLPQKDLNVGSVGKWFKTNYFGGACGYMVMVGVPEDRADNELITITKQYDSAISHGVSYLGALAAVGLMYMI